MDFDVKNLGLADKGKRRIEWAARSMPVLEKIKERFGRETPLKGIKIAGCLHVTTETANLMITLKAGGAETALCASNPLSTQDDVAASLVKDFGISVFAIKNENSDLYYNHIRNILAMKPNISMDDGADLVTTLITEKNELANNVLGGTEETTTGVIRLRSMEKNKVLKYPVLAVNDSNTKHLFDNRYGTGQSTVDGILRATNCLMAGSTVVVAGYGMCGRGFANRAKGLGANVIITEVNPLKALEAVMDGYRVLPMQQACKEGDIFVTLTGNMHVLRIEHFNEMKEGAIVANSGHFNIEIDLKGLEKISIKKETLKEFVEEYTLNQGKRIIVLAEGRLINLAAAEGHPAMVMDMSFANQSLGVEYLVKHGSSLEKRVYNIPPEIDQEIARLKLATKNIEIDYLTPEQTNYLTSWEVGT